VGAVGPELIAQARYWRARALEARGDRTGADAEDSRAQKLLEDLILTLPEQHQRSFAARPDIRPIIDQQSVQKPANLR
jgi:hypothetical protein